MDKIDDLDAGAPTQTSINLVWTPPSNSTGSEITDYIIYYRKPPPAGVIWNVFADGTSTDAFTKVTELDTDQEYEFRVHSTNGTESLTSNVVTKKTKSSDAYFDSGYLMINTGGATTSKVIAYNTGTSIYINGVLSHTTVANAQVNSFASARWDRIDADGPIFVSGNFNNNANVVWTPAEWASDHFVFNGIRKADQDLYIYAIDAATGVEFKQGSTSVNGPQSIGQYSNATVALSATGSFQLISTAGDFLAFKISDLDYDPQAIVPPSTELIGFPSQSMSLSSRYDTTTYTYTHATGTTGTGTASADTAISITPEGGTVTNYNCEALRISATKHIGGASYDDGNGNASAPFFPLGYMKRKFMLNVAVDYVIFASNQAGTIQVLDAADSVVETLTLARTGTGKSPYYVRRAITTAGIRFSSTVPVAAWYHPQSTTSESVIGDETILFGSD